MGQQVKIWNKRKPLYLNTCFTDCIAKPIISSSFCGKISVNSTFRLLQIFKTSSAINQTCLNDKVTKTGKSN